MLFFFYEVAAVSAVIQIGLALPMVVYFHRLGLSGLSANAFAIPLMGLGGAGRIRRGLHGMAVGGDDRRMAAAALARDRGMARRARAELADSHAAAVAGGRALRRADRLRGGARTWWRAAGGGAVAALLVLLVWHPFPPEFSRGQLEMSVIDVGQGDSILVVFPDGKRMLVDGGGIPVFGHRTQSQLDIGEDVVAPYLWDRGMRASTSWRSPTRTTTTSAGCRRWSPTSIRGSCGPAPRPIARLARTAAEAARDGVKVVPLELRGISTSAARTSKCWRRSPTTSPATRRRTTIRWCCASATAALLPADGRRGAAHRVPHAGRGRDPAGRRAQSGAPRQPHVEYGGVPERRQPAFAIISVGVDNSYGHPNRDVLDRLAEHHTAVLRTDRSGLITVRTDGQRLSVETHW